MSDQMNYLYVLFARSGRLTPSAINDSAATIVNAYRSKCGDNVQYLGCQAHDGMLPSGPDTFVVSLCLMLCKQKGITFRSERDTISYSVDQILSERIGTCRITVRTGAQVPESAHRSQLLTGAGNSVSASGLLPATWRGALVGLGMVGGMLMGALSLLVAALMAAALANHYTGVQLADVVQFGVMGAVLLPIGIASIWYYRRNYGKDGGPTGETKIADRSADWAKLLKRLSECESQEMEELSQAIVSLGNKEAVPGLVALMIQSYESAYKAHENMREASMDPQSLLKDRLRQQTGIWTVGYNPRTVRSPIQEQKEVMSRYFTRGHRALDALVGLRAIKEFQALLDNPTYNNQTRDNFRWALKRIHEEDSAGSDLDSSAPKSTDGGTSSTQQSASASTSEADRSQEVALVILCKVCGYKTEVTVRSDWRASVLSGSVSHLEFECHNCKKIFTITKESLG